MARVVSDEERTLILRMRERITTNARRNELRHRFSEAEVHLNQLGVDIPPGMESFSTMLNWPQMAVTAFAARQIPTGFSAGIESSLLEDIEAIWADNDFHSTERQAIEAADEFGCSFVFTTRGDVSEGEPLVVLSARTAMTATCELDRRTGAVSAALEIIQGDGVTQEGVNLYLPGRILTCSLVNGQWSVVHEERTETRRVMCAPLIHGAKLNKPFGRSRISRPVMDLTMAGIRTLLRQEVAAQFYMAPRFMLLGASASEFEDPQTGERASPWRMMLGEIWGLPDVGIDDDPDMPDSMRRVGVHSFQQLSMQPFSDQFRLLAAAMSAESSLPPQYLGVVQDSNPTSAEAIQASEGKLVREVQAQNPHLGKGRRTLALNALALAHGNLDPDSFSELRGLTARWEDPRTRSMAEQSQMTAQQVQVGNLQPGTKTTLRQLPMSYEDVEAAVEENRRAAGSGILDRVLEAGGDESQDSLTDRATALGTLVRAGVTPQSAMRAAGLEGLEFLPGRPVTIRDESD